MWLNHLHKNVWGVWDPVVQTQKLYRGEFEIWGGEQFFKLVLKVSWTGNPIRIRPGQPIVHVCLAT